MLSRTNGEHTGHTLSFSLCRIIKDDEVENSGKKAAEERKMQLFSSCRHELRLSDCRQTPEVLLLPILTYSWMVLGCSMPRTLSLISTAFC